MKQIKVMLRFIKGHEGVNHLEITLDQLHCAQLERSTVRFAGKCSCRLNRHYLYLDDHFKQDTITVTLKKWEYSSFFLFLH